MMKKTLAGNVAKAILEGFDTYLAQFHKLTSKARQRFAKREWHGIQIDSQQRLEVYKLQCARTVNSVREILGEHSEAEDLWHDLKMTYAGMISSHPCFEIAESWFNSVCRKSLSGLGTNPQIMFTQSEFRYHELHSAKPIYYLIPGNQTVRELVAAILSKYDFDAPFEDIDRDIGYVSKRIEDDILSRYKPDRKTRVEILRSVFYRNKAAYIVGRAIMENGEKTVPFILPVLHGENGLYVDSFIHEPDDVSIIFSFTRSYFMVKVDVPSEFVQFLRTLMKEKGIDELYNSIGFNKHGKTEMFRDLLHHLGKTSEKFVIAPGIRGMVMCVFTLPDYHMVFKLIKDKFDPPKSMSKQHVKDQYHFVKYHDRVGRMADTHEFENLELPRKHFSDALLEELQRVAPSILRITEETVKISHLYTERKMIPLNLFLKDCSESDCVEVVGEYGNAIKQLAAGNIFPGDMLLKNFGVTRHKRVVFYDYDEIGLLTDYQFRRLPEPREGEEMYMPSSYISAGDKDVFPEEFKNFIIGKREVREIFFRLHADIFDIKLWKEIQDRLNKGEVIDVFPYRRSKRFRNS
jgi:isocitrate dehydrogenase kinase/phosphatase